MSLSFVAKVIGGTLRFVKNGKVLTGGAHQWAAREYAKAQAAAKAAAKAAARSKSAAAKPAAKPAAKAAAKPAAKPDLGIKQLGKAGEIGNTIGSAIRAPFGMLADAFGSTGGMQYAEGSALMRGLTALQRSMFGNPQGGAAMRNLGRVGLTGAYGYGGVKGYQTLKDALTESEGGATGSMPAPSGSTALTPDVQKSRQKASQALLGGLQFNDKVKFTAENRKMLMSTQDSSITKAIGKMATGENKKAYTDLIKAVVTGKKDAAELNNSIIMAMGGDAKKIKDKVYLPGNYKLGGKSYMMALDYTEGSPRMVRIAEGGGDLEFDPYKPEAAK